MLSATIHEIKDGHEGLRLGSGYVLHFMILPEVAVMVDGPEGEDVALLTYGDDEHWSISVKPPDVLTWPRGTKFDHCELDHRACAAVDAAMHGAEFIFHTVQNRDEFKLTNRAKLIEVLNTHMAPYL